MVRVLSATAQSTLQTSGRSTRRGGHRRGTRHHPHPGLAMRAHLFPPGGADDAVTARHSIFLDKDRVC